jgi:hypothetical protein
VKVGPSRFVLGVRIPDGDSISQAVLLVLCRDIVFFLNLRFNIYIGLARRVKCLLEREHWNVSLSHEDDGPEGLKA